MTPQPDEIPGLARVVDVLLRNALLDARAESAARGGQSPLAFVLRCLELGAIIHSTGREAPELHHGTRAPVPPLGACAVVARAIEDDGQGLAPVTRLFGLRLVELTFEQRIGWALAAEAQRAKWAAKIALGDSSPALEGARTLGVERLRALVAAWHEGERREVVA